MEQNVDKKTIEDRLEYIDSILESVEQPVQKVLGTNIPMAQLADNQETTLRLSETYLAIVAFIKIINMAGGALIRDFGIDEVIKDHPEYGGKIGDLLSLLKLTLGKSRLLTQRCHALKLKVDGLIRKRELTGQDIETEKSMLEKLICLLTEAMDQQVFLERNIRKLTESLPAEIWMEMKRKEVERFQQMTEERVKGLTASLDGVRAMYLLQQDQMPDESDSVLLHHIFGSTKKALAEVEQEGDFGQALQRRRLLFEMMFRDLEKVLY